MQYFLLLVVCLCGCGSGLRWSPDWSVLVPPDEELKACFIRKAEKPLSVAESHRLDHESARSRINESICRYSNPQLVRVYLPHYAQPVLQQLLAEYRAAGWDVKVRELTEKEKSEFRPGSYEIVFEITDPAGYALPDEHD